MTDEQYTETRLAVARTARLCVLGTLAPAATDVWIALHGYGQLAAGFAASAHWPLAPHRAFVFPEALQRFYDAAPGSSHASAPVGASWMTRESRGDDIADNHAYLDAVMRHVLAAAPRATITAFAFSQATATLTRWLASPRQGEVRPARIVLWGGAPAQDLDLGPDSPLRAMPMIIIHGARDHWATPQRVAAERTRLEAAGFPVTVREFNGGHRLDDTVLAWLAGTGDRAGLPAGW